MESVEECSLLENEPLTNDKIFNNVQEQENLTKKIENYLNSDYVIHCTDPKLRKERQKLVDILESYKKLIKKSEAETSNVVTDRVRKTPEIYAILHPDLYKNVRDEEKKKLIHKFSQKKFFSETDHIFPRNYQTPKVHLKDARQEEKERFIRLLASAPARFLNSDHLCLPSAPRLSRRDILKKYSLSPRLQDIREDEKERLAKIFATSSVESLKKKREENCRKASTQEKLDLSLQVGECKDSVLHSNEETDRANMVRVGEYSPLNYVSRSSAHLGLGENDVKRSQLFQERRQDYKNHILKTQRKTEDKGVLMKEDWDSPRSLHSVSTQTDELCLGSELHCCSNCNYSSPRNLDSSLQHKMLYISPREKLLSDLHGVSHCFPGAATPEIDVEENKDMKNRQLAYAQALKEQIEEKKKLEEEKKKREKDEEEMLDRRLRMQQERLQNEFVQEQSKKEDWMAQRQSQEEILRRKIIEMELETKEMKKQEKKKKRSSLCETNDPPRRLPANTISATTQALSNPVPKPDDLPLRRTTFTNISPSSAVLSASNSAKTEDVVQGLSTRQLPKDLEKETVKRSAESRSSKPSIIDKVPLLEADGKNIASSKRQVSTVTRTREEAEQILRAPLDFRIERSSSPPIPAVRTSRILTNKSENSRLFDNKWQISKSSATGGGTVSSPQGEENILTQLGQFRRQLAQEHKRLEARLQRQAEP